MNNLKRYKEITGKEFVGNDYSIEKFQNSKAVSNLIKEIEKLDHYKHLYSEVKKQKDDVVEFIHKELDRFDCEGSMSISMRISYFEEDLLRMLGEIDVED